MKSEKLVQVCVWWEGDQESITLNEKKKKIAEMNSSTGSS